MHVSKHRNNCLITQIAGCSSKTSTDKGVLRGLGVFPLTGKVFENSGTRRVRSGKIRRHRKKRQFYATAPDRHFVKRSPSLSIMGNEKIQVTVKSASTFQIAKILWDHRILRMTPIRTSNARLVYLINRENNTNTTSNNGLTCYKVNKSSSQTNPRSAAVHVLSWNMETDTFEIFAFSALMSILLVPKPRNSLQLRLHY